MSPDWCTHKLYFVIYDFYPSFKINILGKLVKSSTGKYFIGLDHVRAFATLTVFTWHFIFIQGGQEAPPPAIPLSLLTEGHTGVAIFMTLSGYLFAKLLNRKGIEYTSFLWNRFLRLVPLLSFVIILVGIQKYISGDDIFGYAKSIAKGVLLPGLPNGGWSVTIEFHFYLVLPLLLFFLSKWSPSLLLMVIIAIIIRVLLFLYIGKVQTISYWTIIGRIDQFLLGIIAFHYRKIISGKHVPFIFIVLMFAIFYWYFDYRGGFYMNPYPSSSSLWIYIPTVEGLVYGLGIAWYDSSFTHSTGKISRFIAMIGTYSYSIYLFHFFFVFELAKVINDYVIELSNLHTAVILSVLCFLLMVPVGYISYRFIESPFLRFRVRYVTPEKNST